MTPFATYAYFGFLLGPAIAALWRGLRGRLTVNVALAVTVVMLAVQFDLIWDMDPLVTARQFWLLLTYALWEGALVKAYLVAKARAMPKWVDRTAVLLSLLPLLGYKMLPFLGVEGVWGFLGISYLTFRSLDVIFGINDGLIKQVRLRDFWLYLLFFPTAASGPVDRFRRFVKDWERPRERAEYLQDLDGAVQRIMRGFLYKFLLAYLVRVYWMEPAAAGQGWLAVLSYMYAYSLYLFFDFAGYSAFAVGVSYLVGVRSPENFDSPFLARNIRDFWNRWHISLSTWFRDHVYMRFVMTATRRKWLADKYAISYLGFLISMGLMGLWHGLQLHYIVYGLYHALLIIGFDWLSRWNKSRKIWGTGRFWQALGVVITLHVVCFGFLIFSGHLF